MNDVSGLRGIRSARRIVACAAAAAVLLIAGCGGGDTTGATTATDSSSAAGGTSPAVGASSTKEYTKELKAVLSDFEATLSALNSGLHGGTPAASEKAISTAADEIGAEVDALKALDPPAAAQQPNDDLIAALEQFEGSLGQVDAGAGGEAAADLQQPLIDLIGRLGQLSSNFQGAGVDLGGISLQAARRQGG